MNRRQRQRLFTVLFALVNLLCMQLAVASYACPGTLADSAARSEVAAMADAGMPCAESMAFEVDKEQPGLCAAHCTSDHQSVSADTYQLPVLAAPLAAPPGFSFAALTAERGAAPLQPPLLRRTSVLSLAVRHCCFRL